MPYLSENDWLFINDLIFKINSIPDLTQMRKTFFELIKVLIPYDFITFYLADREKLMKDPIAVGISEEDLQRYIDEYKYFDYKRWIFLSAQNRAFRETDLFPSKERELTPYYQKVYVRAGIHYEAILSLAYNGVFVGVVSIYRRKEGPDFSDRDIYILDILKNHLAFRLHTGLSAGGASLSATKPLGFYETFRKKYGLTNRETEILELIGSGIDNEGICQKLFITINTLRKHFINIYRKMGVTKRIELFQLISGI